MTDAIMSDLLALLAGRRGHFLLESGHHGELWLEMERLYAEPRRVQPLARRLAEALRPLEPEAVCGPLVEGAFLALTVAAELDLPFAYTEPRARAGAEHELYPLEYRFPAPLERALAGRRVALVNDVVNAGSAVGATHAELLRCGARPVALGALLVLGTWTSTFAAAHELPVRALSNLSNELWTPDTCPRCAAGEPLERVSRFDG